MLVLSQRLFLIAFSAMVALPLTTTSAIAQQEGPFRSGIVQQTIPANMRLDGHFNDWARLQPVAVDEAGDASGALDLRLVWMASRDHTIWMAVQFEEPLDLFDGPSEDGTLRIEITLPDRRILSIDFRNQTYTVGTESGQQRTVERIHWRDLQLRVMPTHASRRFELQVNLRGMGVQIGDTLEIRFSGSDSLEEPIRFRTTESRIALSRRPVGPSEITPPADNAIRIASFNTTGAGLVSPTDPRRREQIERVIRAAGAAIYCLQGESTTNPETIARRMQGIDPLYNAGEWNTVLANGVVITTQLPLIQLPTLPGTGVAGAIVLTGDNNDQPIVLYSANFPCCGGTGSPEDEARLNNAERIAEQIAALRTGQLGESFAPYANAPVVLAGSLNIVGSTLPRFLLEDSAKLRFAELPNMLTDALETWYDDSASRPPAVRDHIAMTEGLDIVNGFVVNIRRLGPVLARKSQMHRADFEASPHMMLIADCVIK